MVDRGRGRRMALVLACVTASSGATVPAIAAARYTEPAPNATAPANAAGEAAMFELEGNAGELGGRLQSALHGELVARGLVNDDIASISELRLAMGCRGDDATCLARGGRAMGLTRMLVGRLDAHNGAYVAVVRRIDVTDGTVAAEARLPIEVVALGTDAIDDTAIALADQLFPGTTRPVAPVIVAPIPVTPAEPPPPVDAPPEPRTRPRWMWVAFGTSAGVTTVFAGAAIGLQIALQTKLRGELLDAVDASTADENTANDVSRGEDDLCATARASPMNDGKVRNASVTRVCNRADTMQGASLATGGIAIVGLAATVAFAVVLAVNPKPKRSGRVSLVPGLRLGQGATLTLGGRF